MFRSRYLRFIFAFLMNGILCFIGGIFFVWWMIAPLGFCLFFLFPLRTTQAFFCGFFSIFLLWTGLTFYVSYYDHFRTEELLSELFFSRKIPYLFNILTGLLGGTIVGLSALSATHARRIFSLRHVFGTTENKGFNSVRPIPTPRNSYPMPPPAISKPIPKVDTFPSRFNNNTLEN